MLKYLAPMTFFCFLAAMIGCTVSQPTAEQAQEATAVPMLEPVDVCATPNADWSSCFTPTPSGPEGVSFHTTDLWTATVQHHPQIDSQFSLSLPKLQERVTYPIFAPTLLPNDFYFVGANLGSVFIYPSAESGVEIVFANDNPQAILRYSQIPSPEPIPNFDPAEYAQEGVTMTSVLIGLRQGDYRWDSSLQMGTLRWHDYRHRMELSLTGDAELGQAAVLAYIAERVERMNEPASSEIPLPHLPTPEHGDLANNLIVDSQYGITLTAMSPIFDPQITYIDFLAVVDPLWQMDATAFPPQQALTYPTFPDSLVDNEGQVMVSAGRTGGQASPTNTGGLQQMMYHQWAQVSAEASMVTATVTVDLSNLYRQIEIPLDWTSHQEGDVWAVDVPIELGYATAVVHQIEWEDNHPDGRARLTFSVANKSPSDIRLYCLHLDIEDPWRNECANFEEEKSYTILLQPGEPIVLHVRASLELLTPFVFILATD
ncbi:MAG: hypothetical protein OT477_10775 [Chloroflexi bacterium]|nr:hypothetical protein [Chloroflexota bacterium]